MNERAIVSAGTETTDGAGRMIRRHGDVGSTALAAAAEADVKARFVLARANPRSEPDAMIRILNACRRPGFAAPAGPGKQVAMYSRPVGGGKSTEGLSVHFAREARRHWGNVDATISLVFEDGGKEVWRVSTTDLETNFRRSIDVPVAKTMEKSSTKDGDVIISSRTNSYGNPVYLIEADGDLIAPKRGKAIAIAERETFLAMLPGDLKEDAIQVIKDTQRNADARDPAAALKAVCDSFADLGIMPRALEEQFLGHPLEQTTPAEFGDLRGVYAALRSGDVKSWAAVCAAKNGDTGDAEVDAKAAEAKKVLEARKEHIAQKAKDAAVRVAQSKKAAAAQHPASNPRAATDEEAAARIDRGESEPGSDE